ncbi:GTP-binding protein [Streptomyces iconiensis]|uniref:GTP-binding protein n=1 Tax=Streptomyces iconiensis TaxID=1384038 RepID=A0ABT6ZSX4_9ACTN|nr:GTP-binding protein [Streptomyces iconiensis]MDJ1132167.1 GTP-binding protein [Streptomyces iconiensis]
MTKTLLSVVTGNAPHTRGALVDHVLNASPGAVVLSVSLHGEGDGYPVVQRFLSNTDPRLSVAVDQGATGAPAVIVRQDLLAVARTSRRPHVVLALTDELDTLPFLTELWRETPGNGALSRHYVAGPLLAGIEPAVFLADLGCVHTAVRKWSGWDRCAPMTRAEAAARQVETADALVLTDPAGRHATLTSGVATLVRHLNQAAACLVLSGGPGPEREPGEGLPSALFRPAHHTGRDGWRARLDPVGVPHTAPGAGAGVDSVLWRTRRPVHPGRLADALSVVMLGVVRGHGHLWLSNRPDSVVTWRSAGAHLELREAGPWLEDGAGSAWEAVSAQRRTLASWYWDDYYGERRNEITLTGVDLDPRRIREAFHETLLTDDELSRGREHWGPADDPFFSNEPR